MRLRKLLAALTGTTAIAVFAACGSDGGGSPPTATSPAGTPAASVTATATVQPQDIAIAFSSKERDESPDVSADDLAALVDGNTAFALDLYRQLAAEEGNLFMSPHSISIALGMTYAGARGETEAEMADALHFMLAQARLHAAFNALDRGLASRGADVPADEKFTLDVVNSLWGQKGFTFEQDFLDTLAENYGSGMRLVDYIDPQNREAARQAINGWVEDNTNGRIKDLVPEDVLNELTRLVLVNAIFFKASWLQKFNPDNTAEADFHLLRGGTARVQMMNLPGQNDFKYGRGNGWQALEMLYVGHQTSMVVLLPDEGEFAEFEARLDAGRLDQIIGSMGYDRGSVSFPKFEFESKYFLPEVLKALGMEQAFEEGVADFSGMHMPDELFIKEVIHQSFVSVDEEGTEASASTAVIVQLYGGVAEPFNFVADRPFIFLIRDMATGAILFMGRFTGPES